MQSLNSSGCKPIFAIIQTENIHQFQQVSSLFLMFIFRHIYISVKYGDGLECACASKRTVIATSGHRSCGRFCHLFLYFVLFSSVKQCYIAVKMPKKKTGQRKKAEKQKERQRTIRQAQFKKSVADKPCNISMVKKV